MSLNIVHLNGRGLPVTNWHEKVSHDTRLPRKVRDVLLTEEQLETELGEKEEDPRPEDELQTVTQSPLATPESLNSSSVPFVNVYTPTAENVPTNTSNLSESENYTASYWPMGRPSPIGGEYEFVNGVPPDYENSKELGSAMDLSPESTDGSNKPPSILLELRWLPPPSPTTTDGFNVYIYRDGKSDLQLALHWKSSTSFPFLSFILAFIMQISFIIQKEYMQNIIILNFWILGVFAEKHENISSLTIEFFHPFSRSHD